MIAVLGVDAAWTATAVSGFAFAPRQKVGWRLVAAGPSVQAFATSCSAGAGATTGPRLALASAVTALGGHYPDLVAVDMPLSRVPIVGRRAADRAVSRRFGSAGCSTHSPSPSRPGKVGRHLQECFEAADYALATSLAPAADHRTLVEVYPHPALLQLMSVDRRVPYKVCNRRRYSPGAHRPSGWIAFASSCDRSPAGSSGRSLGRSRRPGSNVQRPRPS